MLTAYKINVEHGTILKNKINNKYVMCSRNRVK